MIVGNEILARAHPRGRRPAAGGHLRRTASRGRSPGPSGVDLDLRRDEPYLAYAELFGPGAPAAS